MTLIGGHFASGSQLLEHVDEMLEKSQVQQYKSLAKDGAPGLVNFITAVANHSAPACLQHSRILWHRR